MSTASLVLLTGAGFAQAVGRLTPLALWRPTRLRLTGRLLVGTTVEAAGLALWMLLTWVCAPLISGHPPARLDSPLTTDRLAPLLLAAVTALPLLGPALHAGLLTWAGAGLTSDLATTGGLGWPAAASIVTGAAVTARAPVAGVRHLVAALAARRPDPAPAGTPPTWFRP